MENNNSSYSWWLGNHNNHHQSPWLHSTLTDIDEKTKAMVSLIIQEKGDTFAQRAEMYYKNIPELIKMVEEFHKSYCFLAKQYDQLRSESARVSRSGSSSSNSFKYIEDRPSFISKEESTRIITEINRKPSLSDSDRDHEDGKVEQPKVVVETGVELDEKQDGENKWVGMKFQISKLIEENLKQQSELIRRYDEKRETIKEVCLQLDKLVEENRNQESCERCMKSSTTSSSAISKHNYQSQISKLKELILNKFLGGWS